MDDFQDTGPDKDAAPARVARSRRYSGLGLDFLGTLGLSEDHLPMSFAQAASTAVQPAADQPFALYLAPAPEPLEARERWIARRLSDPGPCLARIHLR